LLNSAHNLWRRHRLLVPAFITALVVALLFAVRLLLFTLYWTDAAPQKQPVEGWMTPRYVAHSYDLPPGVVLEILELETLDSEQRTLEEIAATSDLTLEAIQRRVNEATPSHEDGTQ